MPRDIGKFRNTLALYSVRYEDSIFVVIHTFILLYVCVLKIVIKQPVLFSNIDVQTSDIAEYKREGKHVRSESAYSWHEICWQAGRPQNPIPPSHTHTHTHTTHTHTHTHITHTPHTYTHAHDDPGWFSLSTFQLFFAKKKVFPLIYTLLRIGKVHESLGRKSLFCSHLNLTRT
jgi:hypothetical protein